MTLHLFLALAAVVCMFIDAFKGFIAIGGWFQKVNWMTLSFALVLLIVFFVS